MIDKKKVKHVANVARLKLTEKEIDDFARQLTAVLDNFKILDKLDVKDVQPSFHPIRTENILREDKIGKCLDKKTVFSLASHKEKDYFKVPKIV